MCGLELNSWQISVLGHCQEIEKQSIIDAYRFSHLFRSCDKKRGGNECEEISRIETVPDGGQYEGQQLLLMGNPVKTHVP